MKDLLSPEILDHALRRLQSGEMLSAILSENPSVVSELEPLLLTAQQLENLRPVQMPRPEQQRSDRADFLAEARQLRAQAVSPNLLMRLRKWVATPYSITRFFYKTPIRKEKRAMVTLLLIKVILVLGIGFGSAGGTVAFAERSLPGSPLYPIKLATEEVAVRVVPDPSARALLYLAQAQARIQEMVSLIQLGYSPDEVMLERMRLRLDNALDLASRLPDPEMRTWLIRARETVQTQQETLSRICRYPSGKDAGSTVPCDALAVMNQAREQVELGLQNTQTFRHRCALGREGERTNDSMPSVTPPARSWPGQPGGNPEGGCAECTPQEDQHRYGPQPTQPGPGQPGGNPEGECVECTPQGDQHRYGPQPTQPGPGQPGGNPEGECVECTPQGDQHRHGPQPTATPTWQRMTAQEALQLMYQYQYRAGVSATANHTNGPCDTCQSAGQEAQMASTPSPSNGDNGGGGESGSSDGGEARQEKTGATGDNSGGSQSSSGGGADNSGGGSEGGGDSGHASGGEGGAGGGGKHRTK